MKFLCIFPLSYPALVNEIVYSCMLTPHFHKYILYGLLIGVNFNTCIKDNCLFRLIMFSYLCTNPHTCNA